MSQKPINWTNLSTQVSVAILVGTEVVGASWAAGWALGGLVGLSDMQSRILEGFFIIVGFALLAAFMKTAVRHEPIRG